MYLFKELWFLSFMFWVMLFWIVFILKHCLFFSGSTLKKSRIPVTALQARMLMLTPFWLCTFTLAGSPISTKLNFSMSGNVALLHQRIRISLKIQHLLLSTGSQYNNKTQRSPESLADLLFFLLTLCNQPFLGNCGGPPYVLSSMSLSLALLFPEFFFFWDSLCFYLLMMNPVYLFWFVFNWVLEPI